MCIVVRHAWKPRLIGIKTFCTWQSHCHFPLQAINWEFSLICPKNEYQFSNYSTIYYFVHHKNLDSAYNKLLLISMWDSNFFEIKCKLAFFKKILHLKSKFSKNFLSMNVSSVKTFADNLFLNVTHILKVL